MMDRFKYTSLLCIALAAITACVSVISHNEDMAAIKAVEFAKVAFVDHQVNKAHGLLSPETQKNIPVEKLIEILTQMHLSSYPLTVTATDFEPIPGQRSMNILLYGENGGEKFYYRLVMSGVIETDYQVGGFYRGNRPYPGSSLKKALTLKRSTSP